MAATIIAGVFQSERFFRETWPTISQALAPEAGARGAVRWIGGVAGLKPGARVLDAPCGFGRHAVALARLGYKVTGVDFNETELGRAREAARAAGVVADFVSADMRDTDFASEFNLAVNLEQSIGYFTDDEDRQLIDRFWRALVPGGAFVLDTRNRDQCVKSLPPEERRQFDDWTLRIENLFDAATSRWRARWFRLASSAPAPREAGELLGETDIRLYSAHELAAMLRPERWSRGDLSGGLDGVGLDPADSPAAAKLGVAVVHAPGSNSQSVAEHALMLMLMSAKRARQVDAWTRQGNWSARQGGNSELKGKTLGIVGIGNIGRLVARFAGALGMRVLACDPYVPDEEIRKRGAEPVRSLEALLPQVDVLTCHTPLTDETRGMINDKTLGLMKRGAIFVNTSRGGVQQERAVFEALVKGQLAAAGLDVFEQEPTPRDNPLLNLDNVVVSSHVAGVTAEATHPAT